MAKHELYGCPCCSGTFGGMFAVNDTVRDLKEEAETGNAWSCNWGVDWARPGRRDFLKSVAAAASLAALMPQDSLAQAAPIPRLPPVTTRTPVIIFPSGA